jgi:hypothetical protein
MNIPKRLNSILEIRLEAWKRIQDNKELYKQFSYSDSQLERDLIIFEEVYKMGIEKGKL